MNYWKLDVVISFSGARGRNRDLSCVCLHGDRRPQERKANLEKFKNGEVKFLICTDVAARGIDVMGLPFGKFMCFLSFLRGTWLETRFLSDL